MKRILPILFLLTFSLLNAESVLACVCGGDPSPLGDKEIRAAIAKEFDQSIAVFSGEVIELDTYKVRFRITKLWKGDAQEEITMSTGTVKIDEKHSRSSSCDYRFKSGEKYLVYARKFEAGLVAYKCTGTKPLANAGRDITELNSLSTNECQPPEQNAIQRWRNLITHSTELAINLVRIFDIDYVLPNLKPSLAA